MYEAHHVLSYVNLSTLLLGTSEQLIYFITRTLQSQSTPSFLFQFVRFAQKQRDYM